MQLAQVAAGVPAALAHHGGRGLVIAEVAVHQAAPAYPQLAALAHRQGPARGRVHGAHLGAFHHVAGAGVGPLLALSREVDRPCVFRQAVAMVQRLAEGGLHALFQRQVQRAGAGIDIAQRRRLRVGNALLLQMGQQARVQRWRPLQLRDAVARQRVQQIGGVELRAHHHLRARMQRGQQHRAQPEDVGHGHEGIAAVLRTQPARCGRDAREQRQRLMPHHHALGRARGARGEDQRRHLILQRTGFGHGLRAHGAVLHAGQGRVACAKAPRVAAGAVRCGRGEIHHARIGLGRKGIDLAGRHACVHAAGPGAHAAAGQDQRRMLGAVLGHDQHAVAGPHLQRAQLGLGRVRQRAQVGKAQAAAVGQVDEGTLRRFGQPAVQQMVYSLIHAPRIPQSTTMPCVTVAHIARSFAPRSASFWGAPVHSS